MCGKIADIFRKTGLKITEAVCRFKADERGLSGVVVAILLILVAVLAIVIIWVFLGDWLEELWEQITASASSIA